MADTNVSAIIFYLFLFYNQVVLNGSDHIILQNDGQLAVAVLDIVGVGAVKVFCAVSGIHVCLGRTNVNALGSGYGIICEPPAVHEVLLALGISLQVEAAVVIGLVQVPR